MGSCGNKEDAARFESSCVLFVSPGASSRAQPMRTWFRRKHQPKGTSVEQWEVGRLRVHSGTLLVCDPMGLSGGIQVTNVPAGDHPVVAQVISYAEGGKRLAGIKLAFTTEVGGVPHK